jgi:hypothetical protein
LSVRTHAFCHTTTTADGIRYHWTTLASYGLMKFSSIYSVSCYSQKTNIIKERRRIMFFSYLLGKVKTSKHTMTPQHCITLKTCTYMYVDLRMIVNVKKHRSKHSIILFFYFLENINLGTENYSEHKWIIHYLYR